MAGYPYQQEEMERLGFKVGDIFTVEHTQVSQCYTTIYLIEFPGKSFNSVFFDSV